MHLYLGINSAWEYLHLSPSEEFTVKTIFEECAGGFFCIILTAKNKAAVQINYEVQCSPMK